LRIGKRASRPLAYLRGRSLLALPVQQVTKVELNLKTARTLGVAIPLTLPGRADEVIE
jgi:hypothetical protein